MLKYFSFALLLISSTGFAQNVGIGTDVPTNLLHVFATSNPLRIEGLQPGTAADSIVTINAAGVLRMRSSANFIAPSGWSVTGNSGTSNANFLGTADNRPLLIRTNNQLSGIIDPNAASRNNGYGNRSLGVSVSGSGNNGFGYQALGSLLSGNNNTAIGDSAAFNIRTGSDNTAVGSKALASIATATGNVAIGAGALKNNRASENIALGKNAASANTAGSNILALGADALLQNTESNNHIAIGNSALAQLNGGQDNVAIGYNAGLSISSASSNVLVGHYTLASTSTASRNTMVGHNAGLSYSGTGNTDNTFIGYQAGLLQTDGNGNTYLGSGVDVAGISSPNNATGIGQNAVITASNQVRIGNTNVNSIGGQVGWTTFSDARIKRAVLENVPGLSFIEKLRPVTYQYNISALKQLQGEKNIAPVNSVFESIRFTGLLAQEVEAAAKSVGYNFSGVDAPANDNTAYGLRYAEFVVPLIKAVQEMKQLIDVQQREINALKAKVNP